MPWIKDLENPMAVGDYYKPHEPLEDTEINRLTYINELRLGWRVAAQGMHVDPNCTDDLKESLECTWGLFVAFSGPTALEWADGFLSGPKEMARYLEWLRGE